jgi:hypothetical protein
MSRTTVVVATIAASLAAIPAREPPEPPLEGGSRSSSSCWQSRTTSSKVRRRVPGALSASLKHARRRSISSTPDRDVVRATLSRVSSPRDPGEHGPPRSMYHDHFQTSQESGLEPKSNAEGQGRTVGRGGVSRRVPIPSPGGGGVAAEGPGRSRRWQNRRDGTLPDGVRPFQDRTGGGRPAVRTWRAEEVKLGL